MRVAAIALLAGILATAAAALEPAGRGALDAMPMALTNGAPDAARGRALVADRQKGLCLLCHSAPIPEVRQQGDLAPTLAGAGSRWSVAQLRARIIDARAINPDSIMPAYYRPEGGARVGAAWRDKTLFSAQDVEDVVAWLATLKNPK